MMTKKYNSRTWRSLTAALSLALVISACGGGSDSEGSVEPESSDEAAEATAEAAGEGDTNDSGGDATPDAGPQDGDVVIRFARFFGDCAEDVAGVTDVNQATSECEVIQILENAFNAEDNGVYVEKIGGQAWDDYYTQLSTTFAGGDVPNVAVMHQHRLPDYAGRDLLMPLGDKFEESSVIDFTDYTEPAQSAAQYEGTIYAMPFDIHASLWHVNVDIFEEAGLTDGDGNPVAPTSPDELLAQCDAIEAVGKQCFAHDWFEFGVGARLFLALVQQQGGTLTDASGAATPNSPEGVEALRFLNELATRSNPEQNYTDSQSAFLAGDVGILHNGTWVVDQYNREAPFTYMATNVPNLYGTPSVWGDSHMWVLPKESNEDPEVAAASMKFLEYLYENIEGWARGTGHIAPRKSILDSGVLDDAPQRANYAETASIAGLVPAVPGWAGAWDALAEDLNSTWVNGNDQQSALDNAAARMNEELSK